MCVTARAQQLQTVPVNMIYPNTSNVLRVKGYVEGELKSRVKVKLEQTKFNGTKLRKVCYQVKLCWWVVVRINWVKVMYPTLSKVTVNKASTPLPSLKEKNDGHICCTRFPLQGERNDAFAPCPCLQRRLLIFFL